MLDSDTLRALSERGGRIDRRTLLKVAGASIAASLPATGSAAAQSEPYDGGPFAAMWPHATVDPSTLPEADPPTDPDLGGQGGSSEIEEIDRNQPSGQSTHGGPSGSPLVGKGGDDIAVLEDFEGLGTRDVVRGVDSDDSGEIEDDEIFFVIPSDAQLAVGNDHVVEAINSEFAIFEKETGDLLHHFRQEDWFENVLSLAPDDEPPAQFENIQVFDPRARYDPASGRYYLACVEFNLSDTRPDGTIGEDNDEPDPVPDPNDLTGAYLLSVSDTSDPTGTWTNYRIPPFQNGDPVQGSNPATNTPGLVDFPQLGVGPDAVYLTENFFSLTAQGFLFTGATMEVLDKSDLLAGADVATLHFTGLRNPDGSLAFTAQPANQESGPFHLMNTRFFHGDSLTLWTVENPTDESQIAVTNDAISVQPYNNPPSAKQPGTEDKIDMGDTRIVDAVGYDEEDGNLWAAHTVNDGSVRWYEVDPTAADVVQGGTFKRKGLPTFYPVIDSNGDSAMLVYNVSGPKNSGPTGSDFPRIEVAGRTGDYHEGKMENYEVVTEGESTYDYVNEGDGDPGSQTMRWGDYNGIQVDPEDGTYWVISQYANDPETIQTFGTTIANVDFE